MERSRISTEVLGRADTLAHLFPGESDCWGCGMVMRWEDRLVRYLGRPSVPQKTMFTQEKACGLWCQKNLASNPDPAARHLCDRGPTCLEGQLMHPVSPPLLGHISVAMRLEPSSPRDREPHSLCWVYLLVWECLYLFQIPCVLLCFA